MQIKIQTSSHAIKRLRENTLHNLCTEPVLGEYRDANRQAKHVLSHSQMRDQTVPVVYRSRFWRSTFRLFPASHMLCLLLCIARQLKETNKSDEANKTKSVAADLQSVLKLPQSVNLQSVSDYENTEKQHGRSWKLTGNSLSLQRGRRVLRHDLLLEFA